MPWILWNFVIIVGVALLILVGVCSAMPEGGQD